MVEAGRLHGADAVPPRRVNLSAVVRRIAAAVGTEDPELIDLWAELGYPEDWPDD